MSPAESKTFDVKLVSITAPQVKDKDGRLMTPEEFIAYTARVSNPNNQQNTFTAPKLIKYLLDNNHLSPFEMVDIGIEIKTSRGIAPQILRHWSFSFQEFSQRYAEPQNFILYPARSQDAKNRQNSIDNMSPQDQQWFLDAQCEVWELAHARYREAIERGVAREQARFLLPLNVETKIYMKGNARDWIFYLKLRSGNGTQREHMDIAQGVVKDIFVPNFPVISEVMGWR